MTDYYKFPKYPETSCPCENCPKNDSDAFLCNAPPKRDGIQANCSSVGKNFTCKPSEILEITQQPTLPLNNNYTLLNPTMGIDLAQDFYPASDKECTQPMCNAAMQCCINPGTKAVCTEVCKNTVSSLDPRLIDPRRGIRMHLDSPPYDGGAKMDEIYTEKFDKYHTGYYEDYRQINGGQYGYYIEDQIPSNTWGQQFSNPNFVLRSDVEVTNLQDPMGGIHKVHYKGPSTHNSRYVSCDQKTRDNIRHREDIMGSLMEGFYNTTKGGIGGRG